MTESASFAMGFAEHLAYFSCASAGQNAWISYGELSLPIDDLGFRQGVTAVERLRTYAGRPFRLSEHLTRFENTLRLVQISGVPRKRVLSELIDECLARNTSLFTSHVDVGITLWATPGTGVRNRPTLALHLNAIDHAATSRRQKHGQSVVLTDTVHPATGCWSRHAKVRCRLHYYLADAQADSLLSGATGILRDSDGSWTESSVANIALLFGREIVFAPSDQVLPGITQARVHELAHRQSLTTRAARLSTQMIADADAMLLMGTDTGLWFAKTVRDARSKVISESPSDSAIDVITALQRQFAED